MATVDKGTAASEFDRFADAMDLDLDESKMDAEDLTAFNKQKGRILRAIERGALMFNEGGEAIYTPHHKRTPSHDPVTFHERSGASLMAMDGKKKNADVAKTYAVMADMTGETAKTFALMVGPDIKVCEALFAFLMD